jgi:cell division protein FtsN
MGIEAAIQTVTIDNSKTWHRVRIGPNANLAKLQRIRQQLRDNQIECQLFKVKS